MLYDENVGRIIFGHFTANRIVVSGKPVSVRMYRQSGMHGGQSGLRKCRYGDPGLSANAITGGICGARFAWFGRGDMVWRLC